MNAHLRRDRVFVVDDDQSLLESVLRSIDSLGCRVKGFSGGIECIDYFKKEPCDLLITDLRMPTMDGMELLKEAHKLLPTLPIILMSGYADVPIAVAAMKEGVVDVVEKPLNEDTLLPLIEKILTERSKDPLAGHSLTEMEREILVMITEGLSNKEISYRLDKSIRTVENHRYRLMKKIGVQSSAELVKVGMKLEK